MLHSRLENLDGKYIYEGRDWDEALPKSARAFKGLKVLPSFLNLTREKWEFFDNTLFAPSLVGMLRELDSI